MRRPAAISGAAEEAHRVEATETSQIEWPS